MAATHKVIVLGKSTNGAFSRVARNSNCAETTMTGPATILLVPGRKDCVQFERQVTWGDGRNTVDVAGFRWDDRASVGAEPAGHPTPHVSTMAIRHRCGISQTLPLLSNVHHPRLHITSTRSADMSHYRAAKTSLCDVAAPLRYHLLSPPMIAPPQSPG